MKNVPIMPVLSAMLFAAALSTRFAIAPNTTSGGFELINIPPCA